MNSPISSVDVNVPQIMSNDGEDIGNYVFICFF